MINASPSNPDPVTVDRGTLSVSRFSLLLGRFWPSHFLSDPPSSPIRPLIEV